MQSLEAISQMVGTDRRAAPARKFDPYVDAINHAVFCEAFFAIVRVDS